MHVEKYKRRMRYNTNYSQQEKRKIMDRGEQISKSIVKDQRRQQDSWWIRALQGDCLVATVVVVVVVG